MRPILIVALIVGLSSTVGPGVAPAHSVLHRSHMSRRPQVFSEPLSHCGPSRDQAGLPSLARFSACPRSFVATLLGSRMRCRPRPGTLPHLVLATLTGTLTAAAIFLAMQVARRRA